MPLRHKTFTATTIEELDLAVNAYIGRQTVDSRTYNRKVQNSTLFVSGGTIYVTMVVDETTEAGI